MLFCFSLTGSYLHFITSISFISLLEVIYWIYRLVNRSITNALLLLFLLIFPASNNCTFFIHSRAMQRFFKLTPHSGSVNKKGKKGNKEDNDGGYDKEVDMDADLVSLF